MTYELMKKCPVDKKVPWYHNHTFLNSQAVSMVECVRVMLTWWFAFL